MRLKRLGIAAVMAITLIAYGYFLSAAGHDHASHEEPKAGSHDTTHTAYDQDHVH